MIVHFTYVCIKNTSWKAFFSAGKVVLTISEKRDGRVCGTEALVLKCANMPLNYLHHYDEECVLTASVSKGGKVLCSWIIDSGCRLLRYRDSTLRVSLELTVVAGNVFTYLENAVRRDRGKEDVPLVSRVLDVFKAVEMRITNDDRMYRVDKTNYAMEWQSTTIDQASSSRGWEQVRTSKQTVIWVNHSYQLVYPYGRTPSNVEMDIERKITTFNGILQCFDTFKYLIFTKFALFTIRKFFVQSTASYFLRSDENMLRRNLHIKIKDEIGEDEGGIKNEFFSEVGLEIASDGRMALLGGFLDVSPEAYGRIETYTGLDEKDLTNTMVGWQMNDKKEMRPSFETVDSGSNDMMNYDRRRTRLGRPNVHSTLLIDVEEMRRLKEQFMQGLSFSKQPYIDQSATLKFWQTPEVRNKKYIEDTDPSFYVEENAYANLLTNDEFYAYVGTFLALCFLNHQMIPVKFSLAFLENLTTRNFTLRHVQDTELQRNLLFILREDLTDDLLDTFDDDLIRTNKKQFVQKKVYEHLFLCKKRAYDIIRYFFYSLMPADFYKVYTAQDIYYVLNGKEEVTFNFIRSALRYIKCSEDTKEIIFLNSIFRRKDDHFHRKFLKFVTGSESVPLVTSRLNHYKISVEQIDVKNALFRSSSCVKMLFIGHYDTEEDMERIMEFSMFNTEGFHKI